MKKTDIQKLFDQYMKSKYPGHLFLSQPPQKITMNYPRHSGKIQFLRQQQRMRNANLASNATVSQKFNKGPSPTYATFVATFNILTGQLDLTQEGDTMSRDPTIDYSPVENSLLLRFPYNPGMVAELKAAIPYTDRAFDFNNKLWAISPNYIDTVEKLYKKYHPHFCMNHNLNIPQTKDQKHIVQVYYIGYTKEKAGIDERVATASDGENWNIIFPESVLIEWFTGIKPDNGNRPNLNSYYSTLGIKQNASKKEIRTAYRRMVRQWHPDINKENNATIIFQQIDQAYKILNNPKKRTAYNVGLTMQVLAGPQPETEDDDGWGASNKKEFGYKVPLKCGEVKFIGNKTAGRFIVDKILAWDDITREKNGITLTMVTYWDKSINNFRISWA